MLPHSFASPGRWLWRWCHRFRCLSGGEVFWGRHCDWWGSTVVRRTTQTIWSGPRKRTNKYSNKPTKKRATQNKEAVTQPRTQSKGLVWWFLWLKSVAEGRIIDKLIGMQSFLVLRWVGGGCGFIGRKCGLHEHGEKGKRLNRIEAPLNQESAWRNRHVTTIPPPAPTTKI